MRGKRILLRIMYLASLLPPTRECNFFFLFSRIRDRFIVRGRNLIVGEIFYEIVLSLQHRHVLCTGCIFSRLESIFFALSFFFFCLSCVGRGTKGKKIIICNRGRISDFLLCFFVFSASGRMPKKK